jgi:hypothetical protein
MSALFFRCSNRGIPLLSLYVDDTFFAGDNVQSIQDLKSFYGQHFEMKDLGPLIYFLGLKFFHPPMVTIPLKPSTPQISHLKLLLPTIKYPHTHQIQKSLEY